METKQSIRKQIFAARKDRSDQQIISMSRSITEKLTALPVFQEAGRILAYADYNHEVMTRFLIEEAWRAGKEVAVPRVDGKDMIFFLLKDFDQLEPGCMGIPEPSGGEIVHWEEALMIMPGVAFDSENHRVGYGGGFYDRFLEKHPLIQTAAAAFSFQMVPEVPVEPTDIFPQIIVTETDIYYRKEHSVQ